MKFTIDWKKKKKIEPQSFSSQTDNLPVCGHMALILAKTKGTFSEAEVRVWICTRCGTPIVGLPAVTFKKNPESAAILQKMADEIELPHFNKKT